MKGQKPGVTAVNGVTKNPEHDLATEEIRKRSKKQARYQKKKKNAVWLHLFE